jgi:predicted helicase
MYFLNLHGNTKRKEQTLEGTKDENVFDIEQGVSLSFLIKKKGLPQKIFYSEYFGLRDQKYYNCLNDSLVSIKWKEIIPNKPFYLFLPQKEKHRKHYEKFCSIKDIFDISSIGIVSARDGLCIHNSIEEVYGVITKFVGMSDEESREYYKLGKDTRDWKVENAKKDLINSGLNKECIRAISYRPFDVRYTYYTGKSTGFLCMPRGEVMNNVIRENNLTLNTSRNLQRQGSFSDVLISNNLVDAHFCTGISYVYPLYQYNDIKNSGLFDKIDIVDSQKKENLALDFRNYIDDKYEYKFETEKVLGYIYTILHSPTYRKKYAEFLAIDFPRIPFAESKKIFDKLSKLGWDLIQSHLMKREFLDSRLRGNDFKGLGEYTGTGDNYVVKPEYIKDKKTNHWKVQINPAQYFDNIPEDVYNFYIGGYQVLIKYLKDRKGRILTLDEIENVENIVKVLRFTIDQMKEIDKWTKEWI